MVNRIGALAEIRAAKNPDELAAAIREARDLDLITLNEFLVMRDGSAEKVANFLNGLDEAQCQAEAQHQRARRQAAQAVSGAREALSSALVVKPMGERFDGSPQLGNVADIKALMQDLSEAIERWLPLCEAGHRVG